MARQNMLKNIKQIEIGPEGQLLALDDKGQIWEYIKVTVDEDRYGRRKGWRKFDHYVLQDEK